MLFIRDIYIGLLFGYGAAVPIGPINVEMVRRNLRGGLGAGLSFGLGAGLADMTYFILLLLGAMAILTHPTVLHIVSIIGAVILAWFGIMAFRAKAEENSVLSRSSKSQPLWRHSLDSYLLTLLNPYTILFWSSVSAQVASYTHKTSSTAIVFGGGLLLGVMSWVLALNLVLYFTKHRLPAKATQYLNYFGGSILLIFAALSAWHAIN